MKHYSYDKDEFSNDKSNLPLAFIMFLLPSQRILLQNASRLCVILKS